MEINTRNQLGQLYQKHYESGRGAEVGVQHGYNAKVISEYYKGTIVCVDTWEDELAFDIAKRVLSNARFHLVQLDSKRASELEKDDSLDWVYIDADHLYQSVKDDLEYWYKKVRSGGVISGHDYLDVVYQDWNPQKFECRRAIDEFANKIGVKVIEIPYDYFWMGEYVRRFPSWYFIKP